MRCQLGGDGDQIHMDFQHIDIHKVILGMKWHGGGIGEVPCVASTCHLSAMAFNQCKSRHVEEDFLHVVDGDFGGGIWERFNMKQLGFSCTSSLHNGSWWTRVRTHARNGFNLRSVWGLDILSVVDPIMKRVWEQGSIGCNGSRVTVGTLQMR